VSASTLPDPSIVRSELVFTRVRGWHDLGVTERPWGDNRVKVLFELPRDGRGWPPVATEGLWAIPLSERHHVRLDNVPWFACEVATGDVFRVRTDENGVLWALTQVTWSGNCTIRVLVAGNGPLAGDLRQALAMFEPFGVDGEGMAQYRMLALNVPPEADLAAVKNLLKDGEVAGWWAYEEGCVGDAWKAAEA
jgi:hypothetical protein